MKRLIVAACLLVQGCAVRAGLYPDPDYYNAESCPGGFCYYRPGYGRPVYILPERREYVGAVPVRPMQYSPRFRAVPAERVPQGYNHPRRQPRGQRP
jgi:hypothetical protein